MTRMMLGLRFRSVIVLAVLASLVFVESIALLDQILFPNYQLMFGSVFLQLSKGLFWAFAPFSAVLLLMLIFVLPLRYLLDLGGRRSELIFRFHRWISRPLAPIMRLLSEQIGERNISWRLQITLLASTLLSTSAFGLTPYRPDLNPQGNLVGVDTTNYSTLVGNMLAKSATDAVHYSFVDPIFNGSRPFALLFLYVISTLSGTNASSALRLAPALLAPLLAGTCFIFVQCGLGDRRAAVLAALLSVCSYQVSVGIWAGYYANWLALVESYLFLTSVLLFTKTRSRTLFASMLITSVALLFTHPWTWTMMVALVALLALDSCIKKNGTVPWRPIIFLLATNIGVDLARIFLIGSYSGEQAGYDVARGASPFNILQVWPNTVGVFAYYDGYLANALYLGLSLLAVLGLYRSKNEFSRVLVLWTAMVALPFIFLSSLLESRLVYVAPVSILAVIGVLKLETGLGRLQGILLMAFVVLLGANAAMQTVVQLVAVPG